LIIEEAGEGFPSVPKTIQYRESRVFEEEVGIHLGAERFEFEHLGLGLPFRKLETGITLFEEAADEGFHHVVIFVVKEGRMFGEFLPRLGFSEELPYRHRPPLVPAGDGQGHADAGEEGDGQGQEDEFLERDGKALEARGGDDGDDAPAVAGGGGGVGIIGKSRKALFGQGRSFLLEELSGEGAQVAAVAGRENEAAVLVQKVNFLSLELRARDMRGSKWLLSIFMTMTPVLPWLAG